MATTYRKSPKGVAEIETRAHRLPPRQRSALIVIDGRRTDLELRQLIPQQALETIALLLEQGFIEPVDGRAPPLAAAAPPAARSMPATAPAAPAPTAAEFDARRRDAVRRLTDQVGPMGEALAMRMERCRNASELRPLLAVALQIIGNTRGRSAAADYEARFSDL